MTLGCVLQTMFKIKWIEDPSSCFFCKISKVQVINPTNFCSFILRKYGHWLLSALPFGGIVYATYILKIGSSQQNLNDFASLGTKAVFDNVFPQRPLAMLKKYLCSQLFSSGCLNVSTWSNIGFEINCSISLYFSVFFLFYSIF